MATWTFRMSQRMTAYIDYIDIDSDKNESDQDEMGDEVDEVDHRMVIRV